AGQRAPGRDADCSCRRRSRRYGWVRSRGRSAKILRKRATAGHFTGDRRRRRAYWRRHCGVAHTSGARLPGGRVTGAPFGVERVLFSVTFQGSSKESCTAERCQERSQGYAFFAYPWKEYAINTHTSQGCEESSTPLQGGLRFLLLTRGTPRTRTPG